jgi:hypothetical protein
MFHATRYRSAALLHDRCWCLRARSTVCVGDAERGAVVVCRGCAQGKSSIIQAFRTQWLGGRWDTAGAGGRDGDEADMDVQMVHLGQLGRHSQVCSLCICAAVDPCARSVVCFSLLALFLSSVSVSLPVLGRPALCPVSRFLSLSVLSFSRLSLPLPPRSRSACSLPISRFHSACRRPISLCSTAHAAFNAMLSRGVPPAAVRCPVGAAHDGGAWRSGHTPVRRVC